MSLATIRDQPTKVLDHGFLRLVDYMGDDLSAVRSARVSYNADWREGNEKKDERLIQYLLANHHTSPFESIVFTFEIKCPIFVARQWHRHRTWSYNEVSARYTELPEEFYVPELDQIGQQATTNKQMRTNMKHPLAFEFQSILKEQARIAFEQYKWMLKKGCPRELARTVLPLATYTRFFGTVDLHNLLHFLRLRLHIHAQYEIRVYAEAIQQILRQIVPVTMKAFEETLV